LRKRRGQQQPRKILAGLAKADAAGASVRRRSKPPRTQDERRIARPPFKGKADAERFQRLAQFTQRAFMHSWRAVDAETPRSRGQNRGEQAAGCAGFVHIAGQGGVASAARNPCDAPDTVRSRVFTTNVRAGGGENGQSSFQILAFEHPLDD